MNAMNAARVEALAQRLLEAYDAAHCVPLPSAGPEGLNTDEAYAVADRLRALRIGRGEQPRGWKIGFTNRSIWQRYGVSQPMWAPVWDTTLRLLDTGEARLPLRGLSQPRIEPEIAFGLRAAPRAGMSLAQLHECIDWVAHAFEIVHTHFEGWRFTAPDTAADFALHGALFVGPRASVREWPTLAEDLAALRVQLSCEGAEKDRGEGSVVLDGPLQALQALVDSMAAVTPHWQVRQGDVITTGTITDAWPLQPDQCWSTRLSEPRLSPLSLQTEP